MKKIFVPVQMAQRCLGLITAAVTPNCTYPLINGDEVIVRIANRSQIDTYTFGSNPLVIEDITMLSTFKFWKFTAAKDSVISKSSLLVKKFGNRHKHSLDLVIMAVNGATKTQLEALAQGNVVVIVEHKFKGLNGESAFEIFGREQGMEMSVLDRDQSNGDNLGGYAITLTTNDNAPEGHLPAPLDAGTYADTVVVIAAVTTA